MTPWTLQVGHKDVSEGLPGNRFQAFSSFAWVTYYGVFNLGSSETRKSCKMNMVITLEVLCAALFFQGRGKLRTKMLKYSKHSEGSDIWL